jgi:hypothetical protein
MGNEKKLTYSRLVAPILYSIIMEIRGRGLILEARLKGIRIDRGVGNAIIAAGGGRGKSLGI